MVNRRYAPVHSDVDALVAEVVGDGQELDPAPVGQAVADEVHAQHFIDVLGQLQRRPLASQALDFLASVHGQAGFAVQPLRAFVIHAG
jgi:hypothetical protein